MDHQDPICGGFAELRVFGDQLTVDGTVDDDLIDLSGPGGGQAFGGDGDDVFVVDELNDEPIELAGEGIDTVQASLSWTLGDNIENLVLTGDEAINGTGNALDNIIDGNSASNILDGRSGRDTMRGGAGSDTYFVDNTGDVVIEESASTLLNAAVKPVSRAPNAGGELGNQEVGDDIDEVIATVSYTLSEFVENLTLEGLANINGTGNALNNTVIGNNGNNVLTTGAGVLDILSGGAGDDTFVVDKTTGTTIIQDTSADDDVLDLSGFLGIDRPRDLIVDTSSGSLTLTNSTGGRVEIDAFFDLDNKPISFIEFGEGPIDVSGVMDTADLVDLFADAAGGATVFLIDDDEFYLNAKIGTSEGAEISAEDAQLFRSYSGALGRTPDDDGFQWWSNEIAEGRHDLRSMAAGFIFSEEFQGLADGDQNGTTSNTEFVTHMYLKVFAREPDNDGFVFWLGELDSGSRTQTDVLVDMTQSNEYVLLTLIATADYLVG